MQNTKTTMTDAEWAQHARKARSAVLRLRGATTEEILAEDMCLPGEAQDCGHGYAEHIIGWYAQIGAMLNHNLEHLADTVGGRARLMELYSGAYEAFVCAAAATPGECWHWGDMHGECPGPVSHG